jgi:hypothetical protein
MNTEKRTLSTRNNRSRKRVPSRLQNLAVWAINARREKLLEQVPDDLATVGPISSGVSSIGNGSSSDSAETDAAAEYVDRRRGPRGRGQMPVSGRRSSDRSIAMQTMLVITFGIGVALAIMSFVVHLTNPFFDAPTPVVTIPPMLISLSAIVFAAYHQRNTFITIIAVLIIGVMIASPGYLTSILHILKGSEYDPASFAQLVNRRSSDVDMAGTVSGTIERTLTRTGTGQSAKIEGHLTDTVLSQIILAQGMDLILNEIAKGSEAAANLYAEYGQDPVYRQYMEFLHHEGLIEFPNTSYGLASLTERGEGVTRSLDRMTSGSAEDINIALANPPRPADMPAISLGEHITGEFPADGTAKWYSFTVEAAGDFNIELLSQFGDPVMAIYGPDELVRLSEIDDSDLDMNVRHRDLFTAGEYYFAIYEWFGDPADFTFEISEATPDFGT